MYMYVMTSIITLRKRLQNIDVFMPKCDFKVSLMSYDK